MSNDSSGTAETQANLAKFGIFSDKVQELSNWTRQEAEQADRQWKKQGKGHPSPLSQWIIWNMELPALAKKTESEGSATLLDALCLCGRFRLPLPAWCTVAVSRAADRISSFEARTWDEAFEVSASGSRKLPDLRLERKNRIPVVMRALDALDCEKPPKVTAAIKQAAKAHHVSYELARRWYYDHLKQFPKTSTLTPEGWVEHKTNKPPQKDG